MRGEQLWGMHVKRGDDKPIESLPCFGLCLRFSLRPSAARPHERDLALRDDGGVGVLADEGAEDGPAAEGDMYV